MTRKEHLLVILAEECSEVIKDVSKSLRFGLDDSYKGHTTPNHENITHELGDLFGVVKMLVNEGHIQPIDSEVMLKKQEKIEKFLKYSEHKGTLTKNNGS